MKYSSIWSTNRYHLCYLLMLQISYCQDGNPKSRCVHDSICRFQPCLSAHCTSNVPRVWQWIFILFFCLLHLFFFFPYNNNRISFWQLIKFYSIQFNSIQFKWTLLLCTACMLLPLFTVFIHSYITNYSIKINYIN